ncbi:MAG: hypothetical protein ACJ8FO_10410, partial [Sphingomicrobium sp.]
MSVPRRSLLFALALAWSAVIGNPGDAQQAPRISKPKPAPPGPSNMPPLPPAEIDNKLAIGGDDVNAKKVETRMTVE